MSCTICGSPASGGLSSCPHCGAEKKKSGSAFVGGLLALAMAVPFFSVSPVAGLAIGAFGLLAVWGAISPAWSKPVQKKPVKPKSGLSWGAKFEFLSGPLTFRSWFW